MQNKENESSSNGFNESSSEDKENYKQESYKKESYSKESYSEESYKKESYIEQSYQFDLEETARDFSFGERFQASRESAENWSSSKVTISSSLLHGSIFCFIKGR